MAKRSAAVLATILVTSFITLASESQQAPPAQSPTPPTPQLRQQAERGGRARVIVELRLSAPHVPEGRRAQPLVAAQRQDIADTGGRVLGRLLGTTHRLVHRFDTVPLLALEVSAAALDRLSATPDVVSVTEDRIAWPVLTQSAPLIESDQAWSVGYDGTGTTIAILDSGVDATHPFLAGKVVEEACYSSTVAGTSRTVCPNGQDEQTGTGAGAPCWLSDCFHGTHVAGIAAGNDPAEGIFGVAKGAKVMAVQVFSEVISTSECGGLAPCLGAFSSDVIAGLERVYAVAPQLHIASVNLSLGGGSYTASCDTEPYKPIIDNLRSIGVATVIATGNSGLRNAISSPACISSAVSVASTDTSDNVSWFSNMSSFVSLLAPGDGIVSSVPGGTYEAASGTSMAAPHVAGGWALIRHAAPSATVTQVLNALRQTGLPVTDTRFFGTVTVPRVRLLRAMSTLVPISNPVPTALTVSPERVRVGGGGTVLTIEGVGFNTFSVMTWNGSPRSTRVVSTTRLEGTLNGTDLTAVGSGVVAVVNPAPGGGTSSSLPVPIDPPPSLTVSATAVAPGSSVTVTLVNGLGGDSDWLALASVGSANTSYLQWTYVGGGTTNRTWTVNMPTAGGAYEFRLFRDNGYTRVATSPAVTVDPNFSPAPVLGSVSPSRVLAGSGAFSLLVNGSGFTSASVVRWNGNSRTTTYVSATQLQASINSGDVAAAGSAQITVFTPAPGGGLSSAVALPIVPPPSISVSATTVTPGGSLTATLTNAPGGNSDWLALAVSSAPNTSYLQYVYIPAGATSHTWTISAPQAFGTYEFRLFPNNGYTRAATSATVTVAPGPASVPVISSTAPASMLVGAGAFTLTVTGSGFAASSVVRWNSSDRPTTFVSATELRAAITAGDVASAGTAFVSVYSPPPGGGLSSSVPFTIGASSATLTVSSTSVAAGAPVTVTLTNGPGGATDWLALASTSAAATSYLTYVYVGAGITARTWTVSMPTTPGTYEVRLFLNNGYVRAATSPTITVGGASSSQPTLTVSATSVAPGASVTVTLTGGFGGSSDWLALAAAASPDTSYLQYIYVGAGVTTRTWTVTMPTTPGAYEFRLFPNNGYVRAATSPVVVVGSQ